MVSRTSARRFPAGQWPSRRQPRGARAQNARYLLIALAVMLAVYAGERALGLTAGGLIREYIGVPLSSFVAVL